MATRVDRWETSIAEVLPEDVIIRGERLTDLMGTVSYAEMMYLVVVGARPTPGQVRVMDALLTSLMEHGISPSSTVTRMMTSYGVPTQAAIAAGVMTIGDWHGGACEQLAATLSRAVGEATGGGSQRPAEEVLRGAAREIAADARRRGSRVDGFGHPQHSADPRAPILVRIAREEGVFGTYCELLGYLEEELQQVLGRALPPNIDGVCAALLLDLGFPAGFARACVIAARVVGLAAHGLEELEQGNRWRHVHADQVSYRDPDGWVAAPGDHSGG